MSDLDRSVATLLVRTGHPVWDYGALATIRSLGRCGVPVYVLARQDEHEVTRSKYLTGIAGLPIDPLMDGEGQIACLNRAVARVGGPCVAIAGDDESAVLLARGRAQIDDLLLMADIDPDLPRRLSDKVSLGGIAAQAGVPYPEFVATSDPRELAAFVERVGMPLIVKSPAPFNRLHDAAVSRTSLVAQAEDFEPFLQAAQAGHSIFAQRYVRGQDTEIWYAAGVSTASADQVVVWTGQKLLAHPSATGVGVLNRALPRPGLANHVAALCREIGYVGPFDTDWIVDPAAGTAYLIDFNPRRGAQFRTFQTTSELDVVRATHLSLTGRPVNAGEQRWGVVHTVENLAMLSGLRGSPWRYRSQGIPIEFSWLASDDMAPAVSIVGQMSGRVAGKVRQRVSGRSRSVRG